MTKTKLSAAYLIVWHQFSAITFTLFRDKQITLQGPLHLISGPLSHHFFRYHDTKLTWKGRNKSCVWIHSYFSSQQSSMLNNISELTSLEICKELAWGEYPPHGHSHSKDSVRWFSCVRGRLQLAQFLWSISFLVSHIITQTFQSTYKVWICIF